MFSDKSEKRKTGPKREVELNHFLSFSRHFKLKNGIHLFSKESKKKKLEQNMGLSWSTFSVSVSISNQRSESTRFLKSPKNEKLDQNVGMS